MIDDAFDADARALLDLGREELAPDPDTVSRLRGRIEATVAVAGAGFGIAGLAKGLGVKAVAAKLTVVAAIGVATAGALQVVAVVRANRAPEMVAPTITPPPEREAHEVVQPTIAIALQDLDAAVPAPAPRPSVIAPPMPRPAPPAPPSRTTLARETELVELAARALRTGDLAAVRDAINAYSHETGGAGQLAEDIGAIEIEALCRANDPSASTKLAAFAARWPHAGQRRRLVAACQGAH